ncbi:KR domain-containing protein [Kribbella sp. NPDC026611]|uniref:KR domain-containing protein n=1 Tax=Kribbella sp. NPDC026611 TaxID=3154911 RepID=UPI0033EC1595
MTEPGTVLITGPTPNLGRHAALAMAGRPQGQRPDLLLVDRAGRDLTALADEARALGARVHEIGCDLASLTDVGAAAAAVRGLAWRGRWTSSVNRPVPLQLVLRSWAVPLPLDT